MLSRQLLDASQPPSQQPAVFELQHGATKSALLDLVRHRLRLPVPYSLQVNNPAVLADGIHRAGSEMTRWVCDGPVLSASRRRRQLRARDGIRYSPSTTVVLALYADCKPSAVVNEMLQGTQDHTRANTPPGRHVCQRNAIRHSRSHAPEQDEQHPGRSTIRAAATSVNEMLRAGQVGQTPTIARADTHDRTRTRAGRAAPQRYRAQHDSRCGDVRERDAQGRSGQILAIAGAP